MHLQLKGLYEKTTKGSVHTMGNSSCPKVSWHYTQLRGERERYLQSQTVKISGIKTTNNNRKMRKVCFLDVQILSFRGVCTWFTNIVHARTTYRSPFFSHFIQIPASLLKSSLTISDSFNSATVFKIVIAAISLLLWSPRPQNLHIKRHTVRVLFL
jgi:hypothetical protein